MHAIDLTDAKEKLKNYKAVDPEADAALCAYAATLGKRFNERLLPVGVNMSIQLVIHDLQRGVCGFGGSLPRELIGNPPVFYAILLLRTPDILRKTMPTDFANDVIATMDEVSKRIAAEDAAAALAVRGLTDDEVKMMGASATEAQWNNNCELVKRAHGGGYPHDWYLKIIASGLMGRTADAFTKKGG